MEYLLDFESGTATVLETWPHPDGSLRLSQGSIQRLEDGGTSSVGAMPLTTALEGAWSRNIAARRQPARHGLFPRKPRQLPGPKRVPQGALPLFTLGAWTRMRATFPRRPFWNGDCAFEGSSCDDGNDCTVDDAGSSVNVGVGFLRRIPRRIQCLDPMRSTSIHVRPCRLTRAVVNAVTFRVDATASNSVPNSVSWTWGGQEPLPLEAGGFGTWKGVMVAGNGNWNYELVVDGTERWGERASGSHVAGHLGRGCPSTPVLDQSASHCPGCKTRTTPVYSPFARRRHAPVGRPRHPVARRRSGQLQSLGLFRRWQLRVQCHRECPMDLTGDGIIGVSDVLFLLTYFGLFCD